MSQTATPNTFTRTPRATPHTKQVIATDLGRPWTAVFSELSPRPVAAASLGQVYRGRLAATGEEVAVKVGLGAVCRRSSDVRCSCACLHMLMHMHMHMHDSVPSGAAATTHVRTRHMRGATRHHPPCAHAAGAAPRRG
jgi:hypothetical protein